MYTLLSIPFLFAIIPSIFLVRYFYLQDINKPEPIRLIVKVFFMGILCTIPVIILETIISIINIKFSPSRQIRCHALWIITALKQDQLVQKGVCYM